MNELPAVPVVVCVCVCVRKRAHVCTYDKEFNSCGMVRDAVKKLHVGGVVILLPRFPVGSSNSVVVKAAFEENLILRIYYYSQTSSPQITVS